MKLTKKQRDALAPVLRELGRRGGKASAKAMTPAQLSERGRRAGLASVKARRAKKGGTQ